ncbi:MAG: HAD family phosphatase [Candidatus Kerfeldbacteria bacterium]|nr:HAD family phosphatase [Candidatus Kerfeldbacteria bacterium]
MDGEQRPLLDISRETARMLRGKKAVIFDWDGLLFDSEPVFFGAIAEVLARRGVTVDKEEYVRADLQNGVSLLERLAERGLIHDLPAVRDEIYRDYRAKLQSPIAPLPGALGLLGNLSGRYKLAVASSSRREFIDIMCQQYDLASYFDVIISREQTDRLKPNPECLLLAVKDLGLDADQCLFVDDALRGLRAAQSIGLDCVIVPNRWTREAVYPGAIARLRSLHELNEIFQASEEV